MDPGIEFKDLVGTGPERQGRLMILDWLCSTFDGMLVPTPKSAEPAGMSVHRSFILLNTCQARQAAFEKAQREGGSFNLGSAAFHGAAPHRLFSILRDGLKPGRNVVWYSNEPALAAWYIPYRSNYPFDNGKRVGNPDVLRGWSKSKYKDISILFGVQVVQQEKPVFKETLEAKSHPDQVMVRYLFILPAGRLNALRRIPERYAKRHIWVERSSVASKMEETYQKIHDGGLVREVLEESQSKPDTPGSLPTR
ncbi:hypothetical protein PG995_004743 [Apiospora arundinis]